MKTNTILLTVAGLLFAGHAGAAVYKTVDEHGNVVYTDEPTGDARPVDLPPLSTIPPPKYKRSAPAADEDDGGTTKARGYEELVIASPAQDDTVRDNTGNVTVQVTIRPGLDKSAGHRLQYYLDGQKHGEPTASDRTLFPNVDRGAHTVEVAVVDAGGRELKRSPAVRFYLHRQSVNFPRGPGGPSVPIGKR